MIPLQVPQPLRVWGFKVAASFEHITVLRHETVSQAVGTLNEVEVTPNIFWKITKVFRFLV